MFESHWKFFFIFSKNRVLYFILSVDFVCSSKRILKLAYRFENDYKNLLKLLLILVKKREKRITEGIEHNTYNLFSIDMTGCLKPLDHKNIFM